MVLPEKKEFDMKALIKKSTGKPEVLWTGYAINQDFIDAVEKDYAGECKRAYFTGMWAWGANGSEDRGLGTDEHPTAKDIVDAFKLNSSSVEAFDNLDDNTPVEYMLVDLQGKASSPVCKLADIAEGFELIDGSISAFDFSEKTVNPLSPSTTTAQRASVSGRRCCSRSWKPWAPTTGPTWAASASARWPWTASSSGSATRRKTSSSSPATC